MGGKVEGGKWKVLVQISFANLALNLPPSTFNLPLKNVGHDALVVPQTGIKIKNKKETKKCQQPTKI